MSAPLGRASLRLVQATDADALLRFNQENQTFHAPFATSPQTLEDVEAYIARSSGEDFQGFLVVESATGALVGVANLSQIFRRAFQNAYLGYYGSAQFAGQGLMTDGVRQVVGYAFGTLGLHRVEANIQPENGPSLALIQRLGFMREGFSRRYLNIGGEWRDHERWAITVEDWPSG